MATQTTLVSGTFSGTGTSDDIAVTNQGRLKLEFAGTATVVLQEYSETSDDWLNVESYTAETVQKIEGGGQRMRLNCTAHTNNVVYEIRP